jgi:hypothetical protein
MIKVTQFEPKTLRWWYSQRAKIDMNPSYQRHGRLWSETDKAFLVDSIINEYDVPKIYIADFTFGHTRLNSAGLPYAIIDGKQRLEALFDFFEGSLVLEDDFVCQQAPGLKLGGLGYSDLKSQYPDVADIVDNYPLSVMRVITDDEESINELFVRLNRSKPLTGAEIRNAMTGPVPGIIRYLVEHDVFQSCIRFPVRRGQDKNAAAKLLLFEFENKLAETKRRNLDQFTRGARRSPKDRLELASRRVIDTLDRMAGMIREFLLQFERRRKQDRAGSPGTGSGKRPDRELLEYDAFNRSTNDIASHSGRFRILERRFARYKGTPKK